MTVVEKLARALMARPIRTGGGFLVRCPVPSHGKGRGDRTPSLSIAGGVGGRLLVRCFAGCDPRDVLAALGVEREERYVARPLPCRSDADAGRKTALARELWSQSRLAAGTIVESYLRSRCITTAPPLSIRFGPAVWHSKARRAMPAMVAGVQGPDGRIVAVHRTWLEADGSGKASVEPQKAALGPCRGGAVRLAAAGETLQLAEGIETGLALLEATEAPTWATLGTSGLKAVVLPEHVRRVVICADGDQAGNAAARAAASRFVAEGREVRIAVPPAGYDFADVLAGKDAARIEGAAA